MHAPEVGFTMTCLFHVMLFACSASHMYSLRESCCMCCAVCVCRRSAVRCGEVIEGTVAQPGLLGDGIANQDLSAHLLCGVMDPILVGSGQGSAGSSQGNA